jgi:MbtH protein
MPDKLYFLLTFIKPTIMKIFSIYLFSLTFIMCFSFSNVTKAQNKIKSGQEYKVVINHEEQYSIWLKSEKAPAGWKDTRFAGTLSQCRDHIEEVWTDMRPLSIRKLKLSKDAQYRVVINHEEQYSVWPMERPLPRAWKALKAQGSLAQCMDYIEEVWTDMRPLSLRKRLGRMKK